MAAEVGKRAVPWSIMVRGEAGDEIADLAARHGLVERSGLSMLACAVGDVAFRTDEARRKPVRQVGAAESDLYTETSPGGSRLPRASSAR